MTRLELVAFGSGALAVGLATGLAVNQWARVEGWLLTRHSRQVRQYNAGKGAVTTRKASA